MVPIAMFILGKRSRRRTHAATRPVERASELLAVMNRLHETTSESRNQAAALETFVQGARKGQVQAGRTVMSAPALAGAIESEVTHIVEITTLP